MSLKRGARFQHLTAQLIARYAASAAHKRVCYRAYKTPLEALLALHKPSLYLRPGLTVNALKRAGQPRCDTVAISCDRIHILSLLYLRFPCLTQRPSIN